MDRPNDLLRICRDCKQPFDDEHISHDGDCQCPATNDYTGTWQDVGYNKAVLEIFGILVAKKSADILLSHKDTNG